MNQKSQSQWIEAIMLVHFDIEEGQVVDFCHPEIFKEKPFLKMLGYFSFPDSFVFTPEGQLFYSFSIEEKNEGNLNCYVQFTQKKDHTLQRGYYQKSIVVVSKHRMVKVFKVVLNKFSSRFFASEEKYDVLRDAFYQLNKNPIPSQTFSIQKFALVLFKNEIKFNISCGNFVQDFQAFNTPILCKFLDNLKKIPHLQLIDKYSFDVNIYSILGHKNIYDIFKLWELVLLNKSIMVLADTPDISSELIFGMISLIFPIFYSAHFKPYFTIFDKNIEYIKRTNINNNFLLGVTNPLFLNVYQQDYFSYTQYYQTRF